MIRDNLFSLPSCYSRATGTMIHVGGIAYHLRRGGVGFFSRFGVRLLLVHLAIIAVFGIWWPRTRGVDFFDPVFLSAYACLGVLFAGPAAAQVFSDPLVGMGEALARIGVAVLYGETIAVLILGAGITTVLLTSTVPIGPDWIELGEAAVLGLTGSFAMAA